MKRAIWTTLAIVTLVSFLAACAAPATPAPAPTQPPAPPATEAPAAPTAAPAAPTEAPAAPTAAPAAPTEAPAAPTEAAAGACPADVKTKQADDTNLFPNGIGDIDCKGVHLVVATQTGPQIAGPVQDFWKQWGDKTGGTVEVQTFPFGDLFAKIRTGYLSGTSPFDIIIYASDWAGDIMGPGYVLEVPQKIQDQMGYCYLIPTYRDRILSWGGKIYGLPYDGDAHMIYYRLDWLTDPTYQADFKTKYGYDLPAPPTTWQQYHDIAEFFNGMTIDGQTVYGAGTAFKPKAQSYWTYLGLAAAYAKAPDDPGYFFDPDTMDARINNPGFVAALDMYTSLAKVGPPGVTNWDVGDIRANFPAGKLALAIDWGDVGPLASDPKSSAVVGKWDGAMEPGVDRYYDPKTQQWVDKHNIAPYLAFGGWIQGVSKTTANPDCALDFAAFMGNQNMSQLLVVTPGSGVNPHFYSDGNNPAPWANIGMTEQEAKDYLGAITNIIADPNTVVDLRITGSAEYFDALDTQLARAVTGQITSQQALDQVATDWNAITDRLGRDQQKTLYRQQLGLPTP
jgi:multiple sugar transport system substrate-binding protein